MELNFEIFKDLEVSIKHNTGISPLHTENVNRTEKLKEFYIEHLCTYQLDSAINIL